MMSETARRAASHRDRILVWAGLITLTVLAWAYVVHATVQMDQVTMSRMRSWQGPEILLVFLMWGVMMVAMMVPTAAPVVLLFTALEERRPSGHHRSGRVAAFVLGYVLMWTGFSVLATLAQWILHEAASHVGSLATMVPFLWGGLLLGAGLFQWSPLKSACLSHCRSPMGYLTSGWRDGVSGALAMGSRHGRYCIGCCGPLMAVLFVVGVMDLLWMVLIAALVLVEKVVPRGALVGRLGGGALVIAGLATWGQHWW